MACGYSFSLYSACLVVMFMVTAGEVREGPDCRDKIPNCGAFGGFSKQDFCNSKSKENLNWITKNCEAYCGLCRRTVPCTDDSTYPCSQQGMWICLSQNHVDWVLDNCEKSCGLCYDSYQDPSELPSPPPQVPTKLPPSEWIESGRVSLKDREFIVKEINRIRSKVVPPAMDMPKVSWDEHLANYSQTVTDSCDFQVPKIRQVDPYGDAYIGLTGATGTSGGASGSIEDWLDAIKSWEEQGKVYQYGKQADTYLGSTKNWHKIAAYTQMVTNTVTRVGCGYTYCESDKIHFFVCSYLTGQRLQYPYKEGKRCASCLDFCRDGLCDCQGLLCLHGQAMDLQCCTCY